MEDWRAQVEGADERITSFRPAAAGLGAGVERVREDERLSMLVDSESVWTVTPQRWIGTSHHPSPPATADADLKSHHTSNHRRVSHGSDVSEFRNGPRQCAVFVVEPVGARLKCVLQAPSPSRAVPVSTFTVPLCFGLDGTLVPNLGSLTNLLWHTAASGDRGEGGEQCSGEGGDHSPDGAT